MSELQCKSEWKKGAGGGRAFIFPPSSAPRARGVMYVARESSLEDGEEKEATSSLRSGSLGYIQGRGFTPRRARFRLLLASDS